MSVEKALEGTSKGLGVAAGAFSAIPAVGAILGIASVFTKMGSKISAKRDEERRKQLEKSLEESRKQQNEADQSAKKAGSAQRPEFKSLDLFSKGAGVGTLQYPNLGAVQQQTPAPAAPGASQSPVNALNDPRYQQAPTQPLNAQGRPGGGSMQQSGQQLGVRRSQQQRSTLDSLVNGPEQGIGYG